MKWLIVTCDATKEIVPAQKYLFDKYAPEIVSDINYLDVKSKPVYTWGMNVLHELYKVVDDTDDYVIFGLDDFLPIKELNYEKLNEAKDICKYKMLNRFELGSSGTIKDHWITRSSQKLTPITFEKNNKTFSFMKYGIDTPYTVSTQFSIWNTKKLIELLEDNISPWQFEVYLTLANVGCYNPEDAPFNYIEESALSKRQEGKINVLGLKHSDVDDMITLDLIDEKCIIYGWDGFISFDINAAETKKYMFNYK